MFDLLIAIFGLAIGISIGAAIDWTRGVKEQRYRAGYEHGFRHGTDLERELHVCDAMPAPEPSERETAGRAGAGWLPMTKGSKK